jgi:prepilin-type N-terminal cleavage/methylation domain-containing protein
MRAHKIAMRKGLTLIELMITIVVFVMLASVIVYVMRAVLLSWTSQETRAGVDISLDNGIEAMARDLREAKAINSTNDEIRFQDQSGYYIYYLYNANDTYRSNFTQASYQLRKAALAVNITGNFTYGSGDIKIIDVLPPPASDLLVSSNITTINLSVKRKDETIKSQTQVRPRNL